ncbi:DUF1566 domain-containing protein [Pseudomonas sp. ICMP 8385]|uniref:DUF1566 domain-containing protein n=1 Tax=Pseudomonas sp. ICMP 8385 TaxID=1718920 RepID=UPI001145C9B4|nr:DUF1566 domain-containing protein [Pseudomonas sp. ICMP 8385]
MTNESIVIKHNNASIIIPVSDPTTQIVVNVFTQIGCIPKECECTEIDIPDPVGPCDSLKPFAKIPEVGELWPCQGGINAGLVDTLGDVPAHYLIVAEKDLPTTYTWGGHGISSKAKSKMDGHCNTIMLLDEDSEHPAAKAAAEYQADGHKDFYLPAPAELHQVCLNLSIRLNFNGNYYWSSMEEAGANNHAYALDLSTYSQGRHSKLTPLSVRPTRRIYLTA